MGRVALVPAAGVGSRLNLGFPKQYLRLLDGDDRTMLEITVGKLANCGFFDRVYVIVSMDDCMIHMCNFPGNVYLSTNGGATRAQTVLNGLQEAELEDDDWVFVHDAARPCIRLEEIRRLVERIEEDDVDGAILALPVVDTVKWVDENGLIQKTIDRKHCWRALTPQAFKVGALKEALTGHTDRVTDEASAMEAVGAKVAVVEGLATNIKVTHAGDIDLAKHFLEEE
ncbi:MAG: 2-C-methyl-D-erythritol 4-phosphate cytidylyltransferase [Burkholderiaceae bacterium]|nr:2-C-methyl-D-erythritol 4-phosphate cytidylyltransferase [Burkholderiaceae bacterium]